MHSYSFEISWSCKAPAKLLQASPSRNDSVVSTQSTALHEPITSSHSEIQKSEIHLCRHSVRGLDYGRATHAKCAKKEAKELARGSLSSVERNAGSLRSTSGPLLSLFSPLPLFLSFIFFFSPFIILLLAVESAKFLIS